MTLLSSSYKNDWKELQNGSDIRGVAIEGVAGESVNLDNNKVRQLGKVFYQWLSKCYGSEVIVAVGVDSRISGASLKQSFTEGILSQGGHVIDCGLASTPAMFMTTKSTLAKAHAGVMLTASHLPYNRNGLKFFTGEGGLSKKDIKTILDMAAETVFEEAKTPGTVSQVDFISEYAAIIIDIIRKGVNHPTNYDMPLEGLKIIVDAGNGAGGFFADRILLPLGADIRGSQFLEPDGMFPNHSPNPENNEAMESICKAVLKTGADLGIIFDTDVDRAAVVDKQGEPINRNALIALISAIILEEHPGSTVVTDSITSEGLTAFIEEKLKGKHHRFKRGYKNVIDEAIRLNNEGEESWIAIETSGHAALKENYFLDDGAFLVAKILIKMAKLHLLGKNISDLIAGLHHPAESEEIRLGILNPDFIFYGNDLLAKMHELIAGVKGWKMEQKNFEGIRVQCTNDDEKGWFLLRMSLHDPVMPLNIESDVKGGVQAIAKKLKELLSTFDGVDHSVI
jgi:phosphomannomutase